MQRKLQRASSLTLLALLWISSASGLRIDTTGVSNVSPSSVSHGQQHEDLEQRWVVSINGDRTETLTSIIFSTDCQVYVSHAPTPRESAEALATVRVIGNNAVAIQRLVVVDVTPDKSGELRISAAKTPHKTVEIDGFLRIEVEIYDGIQLHEINVSGRGDVIMEAPAEIPVELSKIQVTGSGSLFLPPQLEVVATALQVRVSGHGHLYLSAKELLADSTEVTVDGSGDAVIQVTGMLTAVKSLTVGVRGSGSLRMSAAQFQVPVFNAYVSGSSDLAIATGDAAVTGSPVGHCEYSVSGAGRLNAGGVSCSHANIDLSGAGNASVRVVDVLSYRVSGSGVIYYVDPAPESITSSQGDDGNAVTSLGAQPEAIGSTWYVPPSRETTHITVRNVVGDDEDESDDYTPSIPAKTTEPSSESNDDYKTSSYDVMSVVLGVIILYAAWDRVKCCRRRREIGHETTPLISSQPSPVYI